MTPAQALIVGAVGGITGVLSLALTVILAVLALGLWERLREIPQAYRNRRNHRQQLRSRRADFDTCRAIDALPATDHQDGPR